MSAAREWCKVQRCAQSAAVVAKVANGVWAACGVGVLGVRRRRWCGMPPPPARRGARTATAAAQRQCHPDLSEGDGACHPLRNERELAECERRVPVRLNCSLTGGYKVRKVRTQGGVYCKRTEEVVCLCPTGGRDRKAARYGEKRQRDEERA